MFDFDALSHAIVSRTVLCIGDLMLDEFVYGEVSRISPEAPAPVIAVQRSETNIGGAGNVARNVASIGARCIFVGLIGEDDAGAKLKAQLSRESLIESVLVCDPERPTTRKVRFVSEHFSTHMLRADWELASPVPADIEQKLIDAILPLLPRANIVLLSDYAKGVLTARVIRNVIDAARKLGKPVIVDPKSANFAIYRGATLLTPNRKPRRHAKEYRRCRARRHAACRLRSYLGDSKRARHDAGAAQGRGHPHPGLSGQGARRIGRRRYRRCGASSDACGGN
jgi:D-beta-D-heptose 7-phosphate kinase / D-beta-D-heptose 1-phosphate adenosyltransferase